ncbi:MAG: thioredoxin domain-containing protein [Chloroflexi bacterium]|nr:thioredoxin domain-containing protein [Chloroflexota bacterium]
MAEHGNDVKFVFRHFPLKNHEFAFVAAEAVEAANEQGKFWEMQDKLLADPSLLNLVYIARTATELGLDMKRFNAALDDHRFAPRIQTDVDEGNRLGINATPTFIVNGRQYRGAPSYEQLDAAVKEALQQIGK